MEGRKKQDQEERPTRFRDDPGSDRQQADGEDRPRRWRRPSRTQAFWLFFVLVMIFAAKFFGSKPSDPQLVSYKEYRQYLEEGRIAEAGHRRRAPSSKASCRTGPALWSTWVQ